MHSNDKLDFLGIYYTLFPEVVDGANRYPIQGVTGDGDVTLSVNGQAVTFVAVQPFDTENVRTKWSIWDRAVRNCETLNGIDGFRHTIHWTVADFSHFDKDGTIDTGLSVANLERQKYHEFFPESLPRKLLYSESGILVTTSGSTFASETLFPKACREGNPDRIKQSPLLLHQLCPLTK